MVGLYLAVTALPALIIARHALKARTDEVTGTTEWYPVGHILGWLTLYALLLLGGAILYFSGAPGGLEGATRNLLRGFFEQIQASGTGRIAFPVDEIARYFTGMVLSVWLLIMLIDAARGAVLVALYFLLVLVGWLSAIVVLVGLVEQWTSLRKRFSAPGNGTQENE